MLWLDWNLLKPHLRTKATTHPSQFYRIWGKPMKTITACFKTVLIWPMTQWLACKEMMMKMRVSMATSKACIPMCIVCMPWALMRCPYLPLRGAPTQTIIKAKLTNWLLQRGSWHLFAFMSWLSWLWFLYPLFCYIKTAKILPISSRTSYSSFFSVFSLSYLSSITSENMDLIRRMIKV